MPPQPTKVMGRRIGAFFLDLVLSYVFGVLVFFLLARKTALKTTGNGFHFDINDNHYALVGGRAWLYILLWLGFSFLLFVWLEGTQGYSPGKAVVGLRTVDAGGNAPGIGKALVRWLFWIVDGFFFYVVGLVTALATRNNQRVGDLVANTYVVDKAYMGQPLPLV